MKNEHLISALIKAKPEYSLFGYQQGVYYPHYPFAKGMYIKNGEYSRFYIILFLVSPLKMMTQKNIFEYPMEKLKGTDIDTKKFRPVEPLYNDLYHKGLIRPFQGYKTLLVNTYGLDHPCLDDWQTTELKTALDSLIPVENYLVDKKEFEDIYDNLLDAKDRIENVLGIDEEVEE
jgi:hypothetical protein